MVIKLQGMRAIECKKAVIGGGDSGVAAPWLSRMLARVQMF